MKNEVKKFEVGKAYWAGYYFPGEVLVIKERKGKKVTFDVVSKRNIVDDKFNVIGREAYVDKADVRKTVTVSEYWGNEMIDYKVPYTNNKRVTAFSVNEIVGGIEGLGAFQKQLLVEIKADQKERAIKEVEDISDEKLLKNISDEKVTISWFERQMKRYGITSSDDCCFDDRKKYAAVTARLEVYEKAFNDRVNAFINAMATEMVDDGSNDDANEENVATDYNFDVEEDDDELIDAAEEISTVEEVQEVDNAAREVAVEEVITTADLEKQLKNVQKSRYLNECFIEDVREDIKYAEKIISDCYKTIAEFEKAKIDNFRKLDYYFEENGRLQASVEELQTEITNRKLNAAAVGMVDDGTNEEDAEEMTVDYNFDVEEDDDDELVDPPIEYHIEIPAALELEPVTFAIERFGSEKIDADAFVADKIRGIAEYQANIDAISAKITELDKLYLTGTDADGVELDEDIWNATYSQMAKLNRERAQMKKSIESINFQLEELLNSIVDSAKKTCDAACGKKLVLIAQDGTRHEVNTDSGFDIQHKFNGDESALIKILILPSHKKPCEFELLGYYNTVKAFNAAIEGLTATIERGDEVYTFPADGAGGGEKR